MIRLFNPPSIDCIRGMEFSNLLHDPIVRKFEDSIAEYCGARYAVSFNSATNAITILLKYLLERNLVGSSISIPSIMPPVVPDAILNALQYPYNSLHGFTFNDSVNWVGDYYFLHHETHANGDDKITIIDSAQAVQPHFFSLIKKGLSIVILSFYPTKIVGSCDGGMILCNDKEIVDDLRILTFNGTTMQANSWERKKIKIGQKAYMNGLQAAIAMESFKWLPRRKEILASIRDKYNSAFGLSNTSEHLYRIEVKNNDDFIAKARRCQITIECGIHYRPCHQMPVFGAYSSDLPRSAHVGLTTVSIPYHDGLMPPQVQTVIDFVKKYKDSE